MAVKHWRYKVVILFSPDFDDSICLEMEDDGWDYVEMNTLEQPVRVVMLYRKKL